MKLNSSGKNLKKILIIGGVGILILILLKAFSIVSNIAWKFTIYPTEKSYVFTCIIMEEYKEKFGNYPKSLDELEQFHSRYGINKEYLSSEEGDIRVYRHLNGKGGWVYNHDKGLFCLNLNKRVRHYVPLYFGPERNKVAHEWLKFEFKPKTDSKKPVEPDDS